MKLFESWKLKNLKIKNRIAVPPMVCYNFSEKGGYVSVRNIEHYKSLAKGGPGLIIQEATCVSPNGLLANSQLGIWEDSHIEGLSSIVKAVHDEGVPIILQIHHAGLMGTTQPYASPSNYEFDRPDGTHVIADGLTFQEVQLIKEQFIDAGVRAFLAGYDGVELHGCHNYLLCEFFNTKLNQRADIYGIKKEQLAIDILQGIRKRTTPDFIIGIRLGAFEPTLEDGISHAQVLEEAGIDFLDISYGFNFESDPFKPDHFPYQDIIYAAGEIKKKVNVPVFSVYGIKNAEMAEDILNLTETDMVDIGRGFLVNYNWANDAKEGNNTGKCLDCKTCMWRVTPLKCPGHILHLKNTGQKFY